ncbi:transcriptional regulator Myc-1-like isoform X2 [Corticium candelabrum]|uniref:transcriptional regulator Myc-1-like isoform X2 n=1 Tax=Corticium candelabrum TaxID=121492 RepID=UPI002E2538BF|nr:transcriptional regulator Myc-1-like isoform X2 [Corticium candelabrum]
MVDSHHRQVCDLNMLCVQKSHMEDEFEACQPYCVTNVEDGRYWSDTLLSGEDFWTKFEIPLTPPRSPSRRTGCVPSTADKFEMLLDTKGGQWDYGRFDYDSLPVTKWRDYIIRNDCMWGNGCSLGEKTRSPAVSNTCLDTLSGENEDKVEHDDTIASYSAVECINPSSVLPSVSPLTDHSHYVAKHLPIVTPTTSSACSSETEEEIDVVTVENKPKRRSSSPHISLSAAPPSKRPRTTPPPSRPATPLATHQAKPRRDCQPRICSAASSLAGQRRVSVRRSSSRNEDSENELESKRTTHNHLERKRRNDLKSSFQGLRMNVPDIKDNEKAPKVAILKKASEHIMELRKDDERLAAELAKEKQRHEALLKQYNALNQGAVCQLGMC